MARDSCGFDLVLVFNNAQPLDQIFRNDELQVGPHRRLQLAHDGKFGPAESKTEGDGRAGASFRYHSGPASECYGASVQVSDKLPNRFELVTRDLYHDFGEFTLTGLGFSPVDGQNALFDHLYLARSLEDFELIEAKPK